MKYFSGFLLLFSTISLVSCFKVGEKFEFQRFSRNHLRESPPPYPDLARTARYIVHQADWGVVGTISTHEGWNGSPFTNTWSMVDGPVGNSTGVPFFYIIDMDVSVQDIKANNTVSLTLSEAESDYCRDQSFDTEDPRCARLTLGGKVVKLTDHEEIHFATNALFSRHPEMKEWREAHDFYPAKLVIATVWILDYFGPGHEVSLQDYFAAKPHFY